MVLTKILNTPTKLFHCDTIDNVVHSMYLIVEFIVVCHKSKFTEKYKGCQIKVLRTI